MFLDISWPEILLTGVVAIVAIGPKELPQVMRTFGRVVRRGQYLKFAMSKQFEEFMRAHELEELHKSLKTGEVLNDDALRSVNFEARTIHPDPPEGGEPEADEDEAFARSLETKDAPPHV